MNLKMIIGKISLLAITLLFVFAQVENASAQMDEVMIIKQKASAAISPKAKPAPRKIDVVRRVSIVRVEKKSRKNYRKPIAASKQTRSIAPKPMVRRLEVPLMALQLRLMMVNKDGSESEVNPRATFTPDDRLRLSVKANQRGFLYIIRQQSPEADGEIIFPSKIVNNGNNLVSANYEYVLPTNCPKKIIPNRRDCALTLFPYQDAPQEFFTLIFSRDRLVGLPDDVKNTSVNVANLMSSGKMKSNALIDLIEDSKQDLVSQTGDTPFAVRIVNVNENDNEEIIETFVLNKVKK
ncbi:MAG: hypothetical protein LH472_16385 [Pyrinomonadaceae bacterium]|nr:hypothetical protein [Pyrinomonadaceae bacterium]